MIDHLGDTFGIKIEIVKQLRVKTLGKSPLDINLTNWLSRCEGSFHKGKRKTQLNGEYDDNYGAEFNK